MYLASLSRKGVGLIEGFKQGAWLGFRESDRPSSLTVEGVAGGFWEPAASGLGNPGQDRLCGTACVELEVLPRGVLSMIPFAYSELFPRGA